jgi:hypothetical protein
LKKLKDTEKNATIKLRKIPKTSPPSDSDCQLYKNNSVRVEDEVGIVIPY